MNLWIRMNMIYVYPRRTDIYYRQTFGKKELHVIKDIQIKVMYCYVSFRLLKLQNNYTQPCPPVIHSYVSSRLNENN